MQDNEARRLLRRRVGSMRDQQVEDRVRRELPHLADNDARELARIVERLVAAFRPERIYVFGSHARGTPTPDSDVDLLIVVASADQPAHRLAQAAYRAMGPRGLSVDVLLMTREEFEWRSRSVASLPATVLGEGKPCMRPESIREALEWLNRAHQDLLMAQRALSGPALLPDGAAYHAQQAAEKALKAFLTARNARLAEPPRLVGRYRHAVLAFSGCCANAHSVRHPIPLSWWTAGT